MVKRENKLIKEFYDLLEEYGLTGVKIFDPDTKAFKEVASLLINGPYLQINVENWEGELFTPKNVNLIRRLAKK